jgi:hypothetical protein
MDSFTPDIDCKFVRLPNWMVDHLQDGWITEPMLTIYAYLMRTCTWKTGVWEGTAERIKYGLNSSLSVSQINRYLKRMDDSGIIIRNNTLGARGGYEILICNYASGDAQDKKLLRPMELTDWREQPETHAQEDAYEMRRTMRMMMRRTMRSNQDYTQDDNQDDYQDEQDVQDKKVSKVSKSVSKPPTAVDPEDHLEQEEQESQESESESESEIDLDKLRSDLDTLKSRNPVAWNLTIEITPVATPMQRMDYMITACDLVNWLSRVSPDYDLADILRWNQTHKSGGLVIRSLDKLSAAIRAVTPNSLLNQYASHDFESCKICKTHKLVSVAEKQTIRLAKEEKASAKLAKKEALARDAANYEKDKADLLAFLGRYDWINREPLSQEEREAFYPLRDHDAAWSEMIKGTQSLCIAARYYLRAGVTPGTLSKQEFLDEMEQVEDAAKIRHEHEYNGMASAIALYRELGYGYDGEEIGAAMGDD